MYSSQNSAKLKQNPWVYYDWWKLVKNKTTWKIDRQWNALLYITLGIQSLENFLCVVSFIEMAIRFSFQPTWNSFWNFFTLVVNKTELLNLSINLYNNKSSKMGNMFDVGNENKHSQEIVYCIVFMLKQLSLSSKIQFCSNGKQCLMSFEIN